MNTIGVIVGNIVILFGIFLFNGTFKEFMGIVLTSIGVVTIWHSLP